MQFSDGFVKIHIQLIYIYIYIYIYIRVRRVSLQSSNSFGHKLCP